MFGSCVDYFLYYQTKKQRYLKGISLLFISNFNSTSKESCQYDADGDHLQKVR